MSYNLHVPEIPETPKLEHLWVPTEAIRDLVFQEVPEADIIPALTCSAYPTLDRVWLDVRTGKREYLRFDLADRFLTILELHWTWLTCKLLYSRMPPALARQRGRALLEVAA